MEHNENEDKIYENLWDIAEVVLRGKLIALNVYIRNEKSLNSISKFLPKKPRKKSKINSKQAEGSK